MSKPNINIPAEFAPNGVKTPFSNAKVQNGFDRINPDVLAGDNLNQFIDDTYKGLNGVLELYEGCVLYDSTVTYTNKSLVFNISNDKIELYHSLQNNNVGNPLTDTDYWKKVNLGGGGSLFDFKWSDHELDDMSWLRADTFSWHDGTVYSNAYNKLVEEIDGLTVETETINGYIVNFYRAANGHKICLADQESAVLNIYNSTGIAWYYILDTTNTQFKLPRTKYGFEGLRNNVGDKIDESLPNITGHIGRMFGEGAYTGALYRSDQFYVNWVGTTQGGVGTTINIDASRSSSTYQDNAPVQERATQMYLYFYVGDYTQTAIEQTAGLNAELFNNKVNLNASNLNAQGMSYIAGLGMPSDTYIDLTLGASNSTYTAPANGYYFIDKIGNSGQYLDLGVYDANTENLLYEVSLNSSASATNLRTTIPILKNNVLKIWYNASGNTVRFRFIYAQGSESEAS